MTAITDVVQGATDGRTSTDRYDLAGIVASFMGYGILSKGIPNTLFGVDLSGYAFGAVGASFGIGFALVVGSIFYLIFTNDLVDDVKELVDWNTVEGAGFLVGTGMATVAVFEPSFFVTHISGVTSGPMYGAMAYTVVGTLVSGAVAMQK
jgi:hypothetical protein